MFLARHGWQAKERRDGNLMETRSAFFVEFHMYAWQQCFLVGLVWSACDIYDIYFWYVSNCSNFL